MIRRAYISPKKAVRQFEEWASLFDGKIFVNIIAYVDESGTHDPSGKHKGSREAMVAGYAGLTNWSHHVCVLDATGQIIHEASLPNTRHALAKLMAEFPHATVALEAGTHSPWISRYLTELGATVPTSVPLFGCSPKDNKTNSFFSFRHCCPTAPCLVMFGVNFLQIVIVSPDLPLDALGCVRIP